MTPDQPTRSVPAGPAHTASAADPAVTTGGDDPPAPTPPPASSDRYMLGPEIARGGMGAVYRATDTVLNREVAVKVLLEKYGPASGAARRFADEARITGQLQHPGIPPVHDLGVLPDGRPFLAMKLIKGRTLDAILAALREGEAPAEPSVDFLPSPGGGGAGGGVPEKRPNPPAPFPGKEGGERHGSAGASPSQKTNALNLLAVFESICHAIAYAHAHHVIHRDLKPANVMVGSFGEVQVMDWGLAKVLGERPGVSRPSDGETAAGTEILSLRDSDGSFTQAGSVLGTPAFMPPEQAVGAVGKVDERSDVFGLGAILAVILTGVPPFAASSAETTRVKAAQGDVADCLARLDASGAEPELVALCKRCLAPKPADRPANANEVARAVTGLRSQSEERAKVAELERTKADVQAAEQRKRRRTVVAAATALTLVLGLGVVGTAIGFWRASEQRETAERATRAEADQRRTVETQRDEIADREKQVAAQKKIAEGRLRVYQKAVDRFVNEAPNIIEGHPLGSAPLRELIELGGTLLREVQGTVDDSGLAVRGEMSSILRLAQLARSEGRTAEAEKHYAAAFKMAEDLLRTTTPEEKGKNTGNLALLIGQRAAVIRTNAETQAGYADKAKARGLFAEAVKMHDEAIALFHRVAAEPDMRDIHVGEARCWLAGAYYELAEAHRISAAAFESGAERRAAWEAALAAATRAEDHFAAGLATGWNERGMDRTRMRQAFAVWERATAAEKLDRLDEADAAFQRAFDLFTALVRAIPRNMLFRIHFSRLAVEYGDFLVFRMKDAKRAAVPYEAAVDQARRLGKPTELSRYADQIGGNEYRAGIAALYSGDPVRARELFLRSVANREEQLREAIRVSSERSPYTLNPRIRLMFSQARAGDHIPAAAYAAELRETFPKDVSRLNYAAQGFSICSAVTDSSDEAAGYTDRAFEALERAVELGYDNVTELEADPDYEPIRGDARFGPLLERTKANAKHKP